MMRQLIEAVKHLEDNKVIHNRFSLDTFCVHKKSQDGLGIKLTGLENITERHIDRSMDAPLGGTLPSSILMRRVSLTFSSCSSHLVVSTQLDHRARHRSDVESSYRRIFIGQESQKKRQQRHRAQ